MGDAGGPRSQVEGGGHELKRLSNGRLEQVRLAAGGRPPVCMRGPADGVDEGRSERDEVAEGRLARCDQCPGPGGGGFRQRGVARPLAQAHGGHAGQHGAQLLGAWGTHRLPLAVSVLRRPLDQRRPDRLHQQRQRQLGSLGRALCGAARGHCQAGRCRRAHGRHDGLVGARRGSASAGPLGRPASGEPTRRLAQRIERLAPAVPVPERCGGR
mmetsp:Transcript_10422/g.34546  ORF Transcript_10422/g.34546 Transcript_10422/m.34546 type:complete len:213 (+) Transcript_10422:385-1023(+)|eukprot:scaffold2706_cov109-Isochrysis_galbana.AAC.13